MDGCPRTRATLCLHRLPPSVETGHKPRGPTADTADPAGGRVRAASCCPTVHVGLPGSIRSGTLLAYRHHRSSSNRSGHAVRHPLHLSPPSSLMIAPACFAPVREVPVTLLMVPGGPGLGQLLWAWASCPRLLMIRGPYAWSHAKRGDKYVTVIIGLPRTRPQWSGPRLWDVAPPRSKKILTTRSALPGPARTG